MRKILRLFMFVAVLAASLLTTGCSSHVGVGLSVGVPIGDYGYMRLDTNRWR